MLPGKNNKKKFPVMFYISITSILVMSVFGCRKDHLPGPVDNPCLFDCDTSKLEVVWQKPIHPDTLECGTFIPLVYNENVLFSEFLCANTETLKMRNGTTGELLWTWEPPLDNGASAEANSKFRVGNKLIYTTSNEVYCIDLDHGQTIWGYDHGEAGLCGHPRIGLIGNYIYHIRYPCNVDKPYAEIVRTAIDDGTSWEVVYTQYRENGYAPGIEPPSFWVSPTGDTLLFILNRKVNFSIYSDTSNQIDFIAFNLNSQEVEYSVNNFDPSGKGSPYPPLVWDNRIYIHAGRDIYCFDALTGQTIWKHSPYNLSNEHVSTNGIVIVNDKLISLSNWGNMYAIDPLTGKTLWLLQDAGSNGPPFTVHDGVLYYGNIGDGLLHAVDVQKGKHLWRERSPNKKKGFPSASFLTGVAINPVAGYIYTEDKYFAMCIKMPE